MEYRLRFSIGYDEQYWKLDVFNEERKAYYTELANRLGVEYESFDIAIAEFANASPELACRLKAMVENTGYDYHMWVVVKYQAREIRDARFVRFMTTSDYVDCDSDYVFLNTYSKIECPRCGHPNYNFLPNPYFVYKSVIKKRKDLYYANNGMMVLSRRAFDLLSEDIGPWVDSGHPRIVDDDRNIVSEGPEFVWIRPRFAVGRYINEDIMKRCRKCGQPTQIAASREGDIFERAKETVESFNKTEAPIVRCGSWFGNFPPGSAHSRSYQVFISGWLHEKIRKLKLKGFVKADYVIHASDEPYDWDPLKDRPPGPEILGTPRRTLGKTLRAMRSYYFWRDLAKKAYSFVAINLYGIRVRLVRKLFGSGIDRLRKKDVQLPFADPNTEASCPVSMKDILEYLDYEAPGGTYTGEPDFDFDPKFVRTAKVNDAVYWIWKFLDERDTESYVTVAVEGDGPSFLGYDESYELTPEQFIIADYYDIV